MNAKERVIYHIPHASMYIPSEYREDFLVDPWQELLCMTDHDTADLFDLPGKRLGVGFSRLVCDVERFRDDTQEPMAQLGMGVVYEKNHDGQPLRKLSAQRAEEIRRTLYDPHHETLTRLVDETLEEHDRCTIVDCRSFSAVPLPYESDDARPDFCIGTDPFHTPMGLAFVLEKEFFSRGYSVRENSPYSGTIVPTKYYRKDNRVRSVMIEVNRGLYWDNGRMARYYYRVKRDIRLALLTVLEKWA